MLGRDGGAGGTLVRSEDPGRLAALLSGAGRAVELQGADALVVPGATPDEVGTLAAREGIACANWSRAGARSKTHSST